MPALSCQIGACVLSPSRDRQSARETMELDEKAAVDKAVMDGLVTACHNNNGKQHGDGSNGLTISNIVNMMKVDRIPTTGGVSKRSATVCSVLAADSHLTPVTCQNQLDTKAKKQTVAALRDILRVGCLHNSNTCGASTVAIDNKIEQAMDLVKSHLMFAVREEVLVLKEQIKELLEKNSQLEYENTVLRAGASPETLAKLSQANPTQTQTSTS